MNVFNVLFCGYIYDCTFILIDKIKGVLLLCPKINSNNVNISNI